MIRWLFQAVSIAAASMGNINRFISFGMIACSSMAWESRTLAGCIFSRYSKGL